MHCWPGIDCDRGSLLSSGLACLALLMPLLQASQACRRSAAPAHIAAGIWDI